VGKIARNSFLIAAMLAFSGLLFPSATLAAGLGRLTVLSGLGEPLKAEIEIVSLQPGEVDSLSVRQAPNEAYHQANIELSGALVGVKFAIEPRAGKPVITLNSVQPMNEPFIDMLVELSWSGGRLIREYTFLLDPPEYKGPPAAAVVAPVVVPSAPVVQSVPTQPPAPIAAPVPAERPVAAAPAAKPAAPVAPGPKPATSYEVRRGDTLSGIAQRNMVQGATLQQMLVALYKNNPDAFDGENMNRLRAGRILNLPENEAVAAITTDEARRLVGAQSVDYAKYRSSLGAAVADGAARPDAGRQVSGKIGAPVEQKPAPSTEAPKDQLRLSRAEDAKAGGKAAATAAADDKAAKEKAIKEANERAAQLERNVAAMQKAAELKSEAGAQLQKQAEAAKAAAPAAGAEIAKADAAKTDAAKADVAMDPAPDSAKADAPAADVPKTEAPKPVAPKPVAPPPPPPASFLDELLDNPAALGGGALAALLLAGYAFYAVRKKRKTAAAANSTMDIEPSIAASALGAAGGASIDTTASQADISAFSVGSAAATDSEEIDPIAEADVYMAYGRDAQAEEILKEALSHDGSRLPVRLKLLEIYANRKDAGSFETHARETHTATGGQGADWEKVVALGMSIDPGNALYGGGVSAAADMARTQIMPGGAESAPEPDVVLDASPAEEPAPPALDFDLDAAPAAEAPVQPVAQAAPTALDFDLDLGGESKAAATPDFNPDATLVMSAAEATKPAADEGLSIDFDLPSAAAEAPAAAEPAAEAASIDFDLGAPEPQPEVAAPDFNLSDISLDLGAPEAGTDGSAPSAQWQEVATKLDLAKAYHDMGDKDGARELLNEVVQEGDAAQQEQAKTILGSIG